jgi:hypothetical protein
VQKARSGSASSNDYLRFNFADSRSNRASVG